tara:strand:- start:1499 stop:2137 length:639 start_codon:yes stop_codon:yes gene_type:complete
MNADNYIVWMIIPLLFIACFKLMFKLINKESDRRAKALRSINEYKFPSTIKNNLEIKYCHLSSVELDLIMSGLKQFLYACVISKKNTVGMPSKSVDFAWHEFILCTREYANFCKKNIGWFIHHTPSGNSADKTAQLRITKRIWASCCLIENIDHRKPDRLPLLFLLDSDLNIDGGLVFTTDIHPGNRCGPEAECISELSDSVGSCSSCGGGD